MAHGEPTVQASPFSLHIERRDFRAKHRFFLSSHPYEKGATVRAGAKRFGTTRRTVLGIRNPDVSFACFILRVLK